MCGNSFDNRNDPCIIFREKFFAFTRRQAELKDVLYGGILPSGAECCEACAEAVAGSEERFVEMMNENAN